MDELYRLLIGALVVWRVTHLLNGEDGPWDALARLRRLVGGGLPGKLLDCFYCLSLWVAAPLAGCLADGWRRRLMLWPALSGAAILLERVTGGFNDPPVAPYFEEPKGD